MVLQPGEDILWLWVQSTPCWLPPRGYAATLHCKFRGGDQKSRALDSPFMNTEEKPGGAFHQHNQQLLAFGAHHTRELELTLLFIRRGTNPERIHRHQINLNFNKLIRKPKVSLAEESTKHPSSFHEECSSAHFSFDILPDFPK